MNTSETSQFAAWLSDQCEKIMTGCGVSEDDQLFIIGGIQEALTNEPEPVMNFAGMGLSVKVGYDIIRKDVDSWLPFAKEASNQGWVSYESARLFTDKSFRSLKRAVSNGEIRKIGEFKPARLSPRSVIEFTFSQNEPSTPKARELMILWRLLLTEPEILPKHWPSANAPDRWGKLHNVLAPAVGKPPAALSELLNDYAANEIAMLQAYFVCLLKKRFGGGNSELEDKASGEITAWAFSVARKNNIGFFEVMNYITPFPFDCPDCGRVGKHQKAPAEFKAKRSRGDYLMRCECGKEWVQRLTFEDYKGRCANIFDALNGTLPTSERIPKQCFWQYVRKTLRDYKRRVGVFPAMRFTDLARLTNISSAAANKAYHRTWNRPHRIAAPQVLAMLDRCMLIAFPGYCLRYVTPSLYRVVLEKAVENVTQNNYSASKNV